MMKGVSSVAGHTREIQEMELRSRLLGRRRPLLGRPIAVVLDHIVPGGIDSSGHIVVEAYDNSLSDRDMQVGTLLVAVVA